MELPLYGHAEKRGVAGATVQQPQPLVLAVPHAHRQIACAALAIVGAAYSDNGTMRGRPLLPLRNLLFLGGQPSAPCPVMTNMPLFCNQDRPLGKIMRPSISCSRRIKPIWSYYYVRAVKS